MTQGEMFEVKAVIRRALEEQLEMYQEVWLTADQMVSYFGTFKKSWLERYGHALPHKQPMVIDEQGREHQTSRLYPRNQIQRMFANGEIERLVCKAVVT